MATRFTATLPDGTESRAGWLLWMLAGLWASRLVASAIIFLEAGSELIGAALPRGAMGVFATILQTTLLAALLAVAISFARRRLLMPETVWLSLAAGPAVMWLFAIRDAITGEPPLLVSLAVPVTGAILGAWLLLRYWPSERRRAETQARA